jgi:hypothetical protein
MSTFDAVRLLPLPNGQTDKIRHLSGICPFVHSLRDGQNGRDNSFLKELSILSGGWMASRPSKRGHPPARPEGGTCQSVFVVGPFSVPSISPTRSTILSGD